MTPQTRISLQQALGFTDDDLQANRLSNLSDAQKTRLRGERFWDIVFIIVFGLIIGVFLLPLSNPPFIVLIPIAIALIISAVFHLKIKAQVQPGRVKSVTGKARRSAHMLYNVRTASSSTYYKIQIGNKSFNVAKPIYDAFAESEAYTLYYVPGSSRIMSGEKSSHRKRLSNTK
jgi:hypothetical protein